MDPQDNSFVDDIVPDNLPTHTAPAGDKFLAWHRVTKEYVRRFQWGFQASKMVKRYWLTLQNAESEWTLDEVNESDTRVQEPDQQKTLKCLMIPGQDLLDVRALRRDLGSLKCFIRYLGFNESHGSNHEGTRIHVSNNAVTSFPDISKDSFVAHDRFESIAKKNSQAYRYLKEGGPYHIVNLDLCGSMMPNTVKDHQEYYAALHQLLDYQFNNQTSEWLLFLTTMVEPRVAHSDGLQPLCSPARKNYDAHKEFAERVAGLFPADVFKHPTAVVDISKMSESQMVHFFGVALGKWLLALCQTATPKWSIALRSVYQYSVKEEAGAVMLSFAFEFKRNVAPPVDATGVSQLQTSLRIFPDEKDCAVKLAEAVGKMRDVDSEISANITLKTELRDAQADLLEAAGYDRAAYIQWVDAGEILSEN